MKPLSFRLRIALLSAVISGAVLLGLGAASWFLIQRQAVEAMDTELRALGSRHPGWLASRANFERFRGSLAFIFGEEHQGQVIFLVKDARGQRLYLAPGWPAGLDPDAIDGALADAPTTPGQTATNADGLPVGLGRGGAGRGGRGLGFGGGRGGSPVVFTKVPRFFTARSADATWRLGVMGNDELRLVVGLSYEPVRSELDRLRNVFLVMLPAALLLVGGGGWLVAGRALRPLKRIRQMAERVTVRGLDQRIPASHDDPEITALIQVLNGMMDRLETSFRQATRFSADASHELKTPLAIMQGELENALQAAEPGSATQQVFTNLLEETQRLKRITRGLLLLSQADAGQLRLAREPVPLSADLEGMIEDARVLTAEAGLRLAAELQPDLWVQADRGLLHMALLNLIANAVKYNEAGGSVGMTLAIEGEQAVVTVCNSGPGIPAADQPRIFERFYRGDQARGRTTDGLGLGLSLAREIVHAHQGRLVLRESRPGRTCFALSLPRLTRRDAPGPAVAADAARSSASQPGAGFAD